MVKKKRLYWLSFHQSNQLNQKIQLLAGQDYQIDLFATIEALLAVTRKARCSNIIISDNGNEEKVIHAIKFLSNLPELAGARFVLVMENYFPQAIHFAGCSGFRDLLPLELDNTIWLERFNFSIAGRAARFSHSTGQIGMVESCVVRVPGRISWMNNNQLRIESKIIPTPGVPIHIAGVLAKTLEVESLEFIPEKVENKDLVFRFSHGVLGRFASSSIRRDLMASTLKTLQEKYANLRYKIFVAVSSYQLRMQLLNQLDLHNFSISVALLRHSLRYDPRYFTPDIVIIEDRVVQSSVPDFELLLEAVGETTPIVVLGPNVDIKIFSKSFPRHKFYFEETLPDDIKPRILNMYMEEIKHKPSTPEQYYIQSGSDWSYIQMVFKGKIHEIHPTFVKFSSAHKIMPYSLCSIESPFIRQIGLQRLGVKITHTHREDFDLAEREIYSNLAYSNTLTREQMAATANRILLFEQHSLKPYLIDGVSAAKETSAAVNGKPFDENRSESEALQHDALLATNQTTSKKNTAEIASGSPQPSKADSGKTSFYDNFDFFTDLTWDSSVKKLKELLPSQENTRVWLIFALVTGLAIGLFWGITTLLAPEYDKSGKEYTDELRKMRNRTIGH